MGRNAKYTTEHDVEIKNLYEQETMSLSKLGQKFKMPPEVIKRKLKKMGVTLRDRSEAMRLSHKERGNNVSEV